MDLIACQLLNLAAVDLSAVYNTLLKPRIKNLAELPAPTGSKHARHP